MRPIPSFILWPVRFALVLYFVLATVILAGRYWVLPNLDHWRPLIERQVSQALGSDVSIGSVHANWSGLNPSFELKQIEIKNTAGQTVFSLPDVGAQLEWSSVLRGQLRFTTLRARGLDLDVRRDRLGNIWLMAQLLETSADDSPPSANHPFAAWLLQQGQIVLDGARLQWVDEMRDAPPLVLDNVGLQFLKVGQGYQARLQLDAPAALAGSLDLSARFSYVDTTLELTDPDAW